MGDVFVITGTGTGVGKTLVAATLTLGLRGSYWKPIQCGGMAEGGDSGVVERLTGLPYSYIQSGVYAFPDALSPHRAAEIVNFTIDTDKLVRGVPSARPLIIEGAGGLLVPITRTFTFGDLFARWLHPLIIVARTELGTINHTLLTVEAAKRRHIPIAGLVFSGPPNDDNIATIAAMTKVPVLGHIPPLADINASVLQTVFEKRFDHDLLGKNSGRAAA